MIGPFWKFCLYSRIQLDSSGSHKEGAYTFTALVLNDLQ